MPRDNEELGHLLEALSRQNQNKPSNRKHQSPKVRGYFGKRARLKDYAGLAGMLALLWGAHWLMRWTIHLFFQGFLSANLARMLLRATARLNRASLAILRRRHRRRFCNHYAGNDNHDRRT
ncbi:hypothetical protein [Rhizobium sp. RCAM05973]|uniref:hypothetical protein n=1 Tax=Rhizobium sp. RCAM05973 TaxID=2994066 RepID=UPI0022EBA657|nr:hypothetical protein [Rhizobium sp. RCAM05973]